MILQKNIFHKNIIINLIAYTGYKIKNKNNNIYNNIKNKSPVEKNYKFQVECNNT